MTETCTTYFLSRLLTSDAAVAELIQHHLELLMLVQAVVRLHIAHRSTHSRVQHLQTKDTAPAQPAAWHQAEA